MSRYIPALIATLVLIAMASMAQAATVYQSHHAGTIYAQQPQTVAPTSSTTTTTTTTTTQTTRTTTVQHAPQPQHAYHHAPGTIYQQAVARSPQRGVTTIPGAPTHTVVYQPAPVVQAPPTTVHHYHYPAHHAHSYHRGYDRGYDRGYRHGYHDGRRDSRVRRSRSRTRVYGTVFCSSLRVDIPVGRHAHLRLRF